MSPEAFCTREWVACIADRVYSAAAGKHRVE